MNMLNRAKERFTKAKEDFKTFFSHPIVSLKDKKETIQETLEGIINQTTLNFLLTLLDENRFFV